MDKNEVFQYLQQKNWHEITEHQALFSMDSIVMLTYSTQMPMPKIFLSVTIQNEIIFWLLLKVIKELI